MKLPEKFRADETLDPEVEAQLAVIDAALSGGPVPADDAQLAQLARELHQERAEPTEAFAAQLDRWAASGFARSERRMPRSPGSDAARQRELFAGFIPKKLIAPVAVMATFFVVVGIGISTLDFQASDDDDSGGDSADSASLEQTAPSGDDSAAGGAAPPATSSESLGGADVRDALADKDVSGELQPGDPDNRKVARTADLTLASEPERVQEVADGVNEVTNRYDGIVVSSSVQTGEGEDTQSRSEFQLRIPAGNLQPALADLSELAHVESRNEASEDITGRFISAQERIAELEAERDGILNRLAEADTEAEADVLRRQLRSVNAQLQSTRTALDEDRSRVQLVPVTVSIVAEQGAGDDGDWGFEEAIDDAGDVLTTAAGVMLIVGAVLVPIAIVALLAALVLRTRTTRARDRALDE